MFKEQDDAERLIAQAKVFGRAMSDEGFDARVGQEGVTMKELLTICALMTNLKSIYLRTSLTLKATGSGIRKIAKLCPDLTFASTNLKEDGVGGLSG